MEGPTLHQSFLDNSGNFLNKSDRIHSPTLINKSRDFLRDECRQGVKPVSIMKGVSFLFVGDIRLPGLFQLIEMLLD